MSIFSIIKKIENKRKEYITKYRNVINKIKYFKSYKQKEISEEIEEKIKKHISKKMIF